MIHARREARFAAVLLVALTVSLPKGPARAEPDHAASRPRVVLFAATVDDPLAGRVAAELQALGLEVSRTIIVPTVAIEEQVRRAFAAGARAAVVADGHRTEFWIAEEGEHSDRVALRQELEIESSPGLESVLSMRTVEFLRVSLGLVSTPAPPAAPPPVVVARVEPARATEERRFSVELASGILAGTGLGPFATIAAGLRARLLGPLGLELAGYAPIGTETLAAADGQVEASVWLAGGGLLLAPWAARRFSAEAGAGVMAVVVRGVGTPSSPETVDGQGDYALGAAFYGRGAARFRLAPRWSLRVDVTGGSTALRRPVIAVDRSGPGSHDLVTWGTAFLVGLGGVETDF